MPLRLPFPQSVVAAILVFWLGKRGGHGLFTDFDGGYGNFTLFLSWVVCRVGSVPAVFSFVRLPTRITFGLWCFGLVCFGGVCPGRVVAFFPETTALGFVVAVFATVETIAPLWLFFLVFRHRCVHSIEWD